MFRDEAPARWRYIRRPLYSIPLAFAISCFVGTLATDLAYWGTANMMWADFSSWLVAVGVVVGWFAVVVAIIELLAVRRVRQQANWAAVIGYIIGIIVGTFDLLVHTRDAWTSVVPWGLVLSATVVIILLISGWMGRDLREPYDVRAVEVTP
jgi:uncharacterized membrane protein